MPRGVAFYCLKPRSKLKEVSLDAHVKVLANTFVCMVHGEKIKTI